MSNAIVLECHNLSKSFTDGKRKLQILQSINMQVKAGNQIAIMGRSGSGKSTLLQLLGGLDDPTHGKVLIKDQDIMALNQVERGLLRNREVGFIYQMHHLLPEFSALENIAMPLLIAGQDVKSALAKARELLHAVDLTARSNHRPGKLSGGERQRVAIARSLATNPSIVLADEPTGNLDNETADHIFSLMCRLNRERGTTFIIVTHDQALAAKMDHVYRLHDGDLKVAK